MVIIEPSLISGLTLIYTYHLILLIGVEQAPVDESNVINGDARSVSHDNLMFQPVLYSYLTGDRHIAASGYFIVRDKEGDGDSRLFFDVLFDDSRAGLRLCVFLCRKSGIWRRIIMQNHFKGGTQ